MPHLVLQFFDIRVDVVNLSIQQVGAASAVIQRAVVVIDGPLGSWENERVQTPACYVATTGGQSYCDDTVSGNLKLTTTSSMDLFRLCSCAQAMELALRFLS